MNPALVSTHRGGASLEVMCEAREGDRRGREDCLGNSAVVHVVGDIAVAGAVVDVRAVVVHDLELPHAASQGVAALASVHLHQLVMVQPQLRLYARVIHRALRLLLLLQRVIPCLGLCLQRKGLDGRIGVVIDEGEGVDA